MLNSKREMIRSMDSERCMDQKNVQFVFNMRVSNMIADNSQRET